MSAPARTIDDLRRERARLGVDLLDLDEHHRERVAAFLAERDRARRAVIHREIRTAETKLREIRTAFAALVAEIEGRR